MADPNKSESQTSHSQSFAMNYHALHPHLYNLEPPLFFVPSFLDAINENTEESFRRIISEPVPGVYTFHIFRPEFCEMLIAEVENYEKWASETKHKIDRPNTLNKYGAVLDHFGFYPMLQNLMTQFVTPMATVFFPDIGGSSLDSHHGFVVEYSKDKDLGLGFHADDSEVTLNVCLGKQFCGGSIYFKGVRCRRHLNGESRPEEELEYCHVPGKAVLHCGSHRHGANAIKCGYRMNLILWCRSSSFRKMEEANRSGGSDFSSWCARCFHMRQRSSK